MACMEIVVSYLGHKVASMVIVVPLWDTCKVIVVSFWDTIWCIG